MAKHGFHKDSYYALCDRCGIKYYGDELYFETYGRTTTSSRVCKHCLDENNPILTNFTPGENMYIPWVRIRADQTPVHQTGATIDLAIIDYAIIDTSSPPVYYWAEQT